MRLRLTHPTAGEVDVGGVPIREVSRDAIGRLVGYVSQQPFVFAGTIAQNIAYDTSRIRSELGYREPIPEEQGLAKTLNVCLH